MALREKVSSLALAAGKGGPSGFEARGRIRSHQAPRGGGSGGSCDRCHKAENRVYEAQTRLCRGGKACPGLSPCLRVLRVPSGKQHHLSSRLHTQDGVPGAGDTERRTVTLRQHTRFHFHRASTPPPTPHHVQLHGVISPTSNFKHALNEPSLSGWVAALRRPPLREADVCLSPLL